MIIVIIIINFDQKEMWVVLTSRGAGERANQAVTTPEAGEWPGARGDYHKWPGAYMVIIVNSSLLVGARGDCNES